MSIYISVCLLQKKHFHRIMNTRAALLNICNTRIYVNMALLLNIKNDNLGIATSHQKWWPFSKVNRSVPRNVVYVLPALLKYSTQAFLFNTKQNIKWNIFQNRYRKVGQVEKSCHVLQAKQYYSVLNYSALCENI